MFFIGRASGFPLLLFFAFAMGGGGAGVHISMTTLPMAWFEKRRLGGALGIVTGGTGVGIVLTGLLLPYLLVNLKEGAWRQCWSLLSSITFLIFLVSLLLLKEKPSQTGFLNSFLSRCNGSSPSMPRGDRMTLNAIFVIYFIFGFAYNIYVTYFVAFTVEEIRLTERAAGGIWSIFGWMCVVSGWIWGFLSDRLGRRKALRWNNGLISLAVLIPLLFHNPVLLALSAFLFGATFLGTVTVIAACVGDEVMDKKATIYGWVTLIHGIGQLLGTILGGYLRDLTGSFQVTLLASFVGFVLCLILTGLTPSISPEKGRLRGNPS